MSFVVTWMDPEMIKLSESEKDKYNMISFIYISYKYDTDELISKTEIDSQTEKRNLWLPWEKWWEQEVGIVRYTHSYI